MDIVERIRSRLNNAPLSTEFLLDDAANEIERLRKALENAIAHARNWKSVA